MIGNWGEREEISRRAKQIELSKAEEDEIEMIQVGRFGNMVAANGGGGWEVSSVEINLLAFSECGILLSCLLDPEIN
ncbi:hypothetical protein ACFX13_045638 [Malus domestica]